MQNIIKYVEQKNIFRRLFKQEELVFGKDDQLIANLLENDLSPENLCCDGELRGKPLIAKKKFLVAAAKEFMKAHKNITIRF